MRPQTLGLIVASTVTALFLAAVAVVAVNEFVPAPAHQAPGQQPQPFAFRFDAPVAVPDMDIAPEAFAPAQPIAPADLPNERGIAVPAKEFVLSGPHTHGNLAIFLIHGEDKLNGQRVITLQEGIEQGLAVVHETRGSQLRVDNRSNATLFIQAGDIVKGGTQDRTLPFDMLIAANTLNAPLPALCVEQGRSAPRQNEVSTSFSAASEQLPGRTLRLAAHRSAQNDVWANVQKLQQNLARTTGGSVQAPLSQTSLQLSLEHPRVQGAVGDAIANLRDIAGGKNDVIGYAVAVNGVVQSADVYASNALFEKVWPKLLKASAVDALSQMNPGPHRAPAADSVRAFLADAENGQPSRVQGAHRGTTLRFETPTQLLLETADPAQARVVLHRSYLAK